MARAAARLAKREKRMERHAAAVRASIATRQALRAARLASDPASGVRVPKPSKTGAELDAELLARLTTDLAPKRVAKQPREKLDPSIIEKRPWRGFQTRAEKKALERLKRQEQLARKREREKMEREELARKQEKARKKELAALKNKALRVQRKRKALQEARKERKRLESMMPQTGALPEVDAAIVGLLSLQTWQG